MHRTRAHAALLSVTLCSLALACGALVAGTARAAPVVWDSAAGGNGHSYEVVLDPNPVPWGVAAAAAAGAGGYLATVTSQAENDFLVATFGAVGSGFVWLGATDASIEGEWRWVTGPEAGTQFWQGGVGGSPTPPFDFTMWSSTEPNDCNGEDFAALAVGSLLLGEWFDAKETADWRAAPARMGLAAQLNPGPGSRAMTLRPASDSNARLASARHRASCTDAGVREGRAESPRAGVSPPGAVRSGRRWPGRSRRLASAKSCSSSPRCPRRPLSRASP